MFSRNKLYDASQANVIAIPRSEEEVKLKIDACLELINYFKSEKSPSGVLLDTTKVRLLNNAKFMYYLIRLLELLYGSKYSQTSVARTSLGPWKIVQTWVVRVAVG